MPSVSGKQKKFMAAVAHNPEFAKKADVPQSVGKDFVAADKVKASNARPDLQGVNKPKTDHGSMSLFNKGGAMKSDMKEDMKMDKSQDKAMVKKAVGMHDKQMHGGKSTDMDKLKKGGMPMVMKDGKKMPAFAAKKGGVTKMAKGGMAKGGGIESKGKTKGTMVKMKSGGKSC